jgi:TolB-like protein
LALPDKPSIAVLPFQNMSGEPDQDYFADGMVEDIVTGLSRIKWLFVIARNSSFVYKGKAVDVRQVGRELGVRYVLEGGVRQAGGRVWITAQLIDAETGAHLWAEKFDGGLRDVFELQDQITERVVGIVEPSLRKSELERSRRKRPESLDAYDLYLRALPYFTMISIGNVPIAAGFLRDALKLDPNYPAAHAYLAWSHQISYSHGGLNEADRIAGLRHSRAAIANDVDDATALAVGANVIGLLGKDAEPALNAIERALSLNRHVPRRSILAHIFTLGAGIQSPGPNTPIARYVLARSIHSLFMSISRSPMWRFRRSDTERRRLIGESALKPIPIWACSLSARRRCWRSQGAWTRRGRSSREGWRSNRNFEFALFAN